ncbi:MAG: hypothetical protein R3A51_08615 [Nannocystaceae bacterium]|nr:hypothetical protein [Myxococcales bacterium]
MRQDDLPSRWRARLAAHLAAKGDGPRDQLSAFDFPPRAVEVAFVDGSHARFKYAFWLEEPALRELCVFTEHCGYIVLARGAVESIQEAPL